MKPSQSDSHGPGRSARVGSGRDGLAMNALVRRVLACAVFALAILLPNPGPFGLGRVALGPEDAAALPHTPEPSVFYTKSLRLEPGQDPTRLGLRDQLVRLGYRGRDAIEVDTGEFHASGKRISIGRRAFQGPDGPVAATRLRIDLGKHGRIQKIRDAAGRRLAFAELEPERLASSESERIAIRTTLAEMPEHLVRAVLEVEDQHFYEHGGLDLSRIIGAGLANLRAGRVVQGGSTITQQLVKNVYLTQERTLWRKLREARLARQLEARLSKDEILEAYLNEIYLGQDRSREVHGAGAGAWHYFSKPIGELSLADSALLAGLIRGPNLYRPHEYPERTRERRDQVLDQLLRSGTIGADAYRQAIEAPLGLRRGPMEVAAAGYFTDLARPELLALVEPHEVERESLSIHTSLDGRLQRVAARAAREGLAALERQYPKLERSDSPLQTAIVALDPRSGEVLALVGGRSWIDSPFNRAVHARRQPGSAFKPIVALSALARNGRISPTHTLASVLIDEPLEIEIDENKFWSPANHDREYRGSVTLRDAMEQSLNVPMTRLALDIGPLQIIRTARRLGIESKLRPVPSLALGTYEVSPLELTRAYATLAASGRRPTLRAIRSVYTANRELRLKLGPASRRVYSSDETYLVTSALRGVVDRGTGRGLRARGLSAPLAGKTGTTNQYRDGWFVGYTPDLVVGVWVGFDDGRSMGLSGSRSALPVFARFLREALAGDASNAFSVPRGIARLDVDPETGLRADRICSGRPEVFIAGTEPLESCGDRLWGERRYGRFYRDDRELEHSRVGARISRRKPGVRRGWRRP